MIPPHSHSQAGFALASLFGILGTTPLILGLARLGQGAGASAFSPASSAAVGRLAGPAAAGSYFGNTGPGRGWATCSARWWASGWDFFQ